MNPSGIDANESVTHRSSGPLRQISLRRYGLAILSVGVALGASLLLDHFHFRVPSALLLFAVAISSWYGGLGPAVFAVILSTIGFYWYFVQPVRTIYIYRPEIPNFIIFTAFAALLSWFGTVRRRVEKDLGDQAAALRDSEAQLAEAQRLSHTGSWYLDVVHNRLSWSDEVFRIFGIPFGTPLTYETFLAAVHPDDRAFVDQAWKKTLLGAAYDIEHRILVGREVRRVRERAQLEFDADGRATKGIGAVQDITERKRAEEALRERADLLSLTHDTVFVMDMKGVIKYWNRGAEERYGWNAEQAVGKVVHDVLNTVFPSPLEEIKAQVTRTGRWEGELLHTKKDGTQVVAASRWALQRDEQGAPVAILETNNDITERKQAEKALRRLNRELRAVSNCNQVLLRATDEQSLLEEICRIVGEEAGYRMVFVAYAEHDEAKRMRPVAWTGAEEGYLASVGITWADTERGRGPTRTAVRSGKTCCVQDFATDPRVALWRGSALQHGFRSTIALPLKDEQGKTFGCLTIFSAQPNTFTPEEVRLLEELAADLAFGIVTLRSRAARKRAEQEVALLSFALNKIREAALLTDDRARFQYVNDEACRVLCYSRAELLGLSVSDIDPEFPAERWSDHWRDLKAQRSLSFEGRHRTRDGRIFPVEISANYFEYGGRAYNLALVRDISERKRADERLRQSEAYLAEAQRLSHTGSWAFDIASDRYVYVSEECLRIFGFEPQEALPTREAVFRRIHPDDSERVNRGFEKSVHEKVESSDEFRIVLPDGAVKNVHVIRHPVLSSAGDVVKLFGTAVDITERKRAEEALRRSETYLEEGQRLSHTGSWAWSPATRQSLYWSKEMFRIFGLNPQEGVPTTETFWQRIHPEDLDRTYELLTKAALGNMEYEHDHRIVLPDGTVKHIHAIGHPVLGENGQVAEYVGTAMDVTERKRTEEELRESEKRFRTFVDHAGDALFVYDLEQRTVVDVNRSACESLGYARQELIGKTPLGFQPDSDQATMESVAERTAAGETVFDTHWHRRKDGSTFPVEVHTSLVSYGGRRFLLMVARDISDRVRADEQRDKLRQLEAELVHLDRLTMLGELTASIAHEVNQPLSGVVSNASANLRWLAGDSPNLEEAREAARRIVRDGKRAGEVIARIRALTKKASTPREKLDLNETLRQVLALVGDEAKRKSVNIRTKFADDLSPVSGDQVQLQQVVLNLAMNAIEAMSNVGERARELLMTTRNIDPDQVQVTVEDSGIGLDPNTMPKIFEPFYTTKPTGMGMGLSISRSIVQSHGGRLWATAKDGPGTIFYFTLPKYHEEESHAGVSAA